MRAVARLVMSEILLSTLVTTAMAQPSLPVRPAGVEPIVRAMATCSFLAGKSYDYASVFEAEGRLAERKVQRWPSLQARARYGNQVAGDETTVANGYEADASVPVLDLVTNRSIDAEQRSVELEKTRYAARAYERTNESIASAIDLVVRERELQTLQQENEELTVLSKSLTSAGRIGVGESSSGLLAQSSLKRNTALMKARELELLRLRRDFVLRFGYPAPALRIEDEPRVAAIPATRTEVSIRELDSEASALNAEIATEKSYLIPRLSLTGAFVSERGYYPQDAYNVGLQLDLTGWLRGSEIQDKLVARKQSLLSRKERELRRLDNEAKMEALELTTLNEQISLLNQAVAAATKAKDVSRHRVRSGRMPYSEYLQIQETVRELQRELNETRATRLRLAMGRFAKSVFGDPKALTADACLLQGQN